MLVQPADHKTLDALWEKSDSAHGARPGVAPYYMLRAVGKLAIWPRLAHSFAQAHVPEAAAAKAQFVKRVLRARRWNPKP